MDKIKSIVKRHRPSVAFVFKKYGIKAMPTPKALAEAFIQLKDTDFYLDLNNAILKRKLGHSNFEDNYDYYLVDDDSFDDGGETVGLYYDDDGDGFDDFRGKLKARRIKRKEKKAAKKAVKYKAPTTTATSTGSFIPDAELVDANSGLSSSGKAEMAGNILGSLVTAGTNIAGAVMGGRSNNSNVTNLEDVDDPDGYVPTPEQGMKKYVPYIIGGVALLLVFGGLIFFLKRNK